MNKGFLFRSGRCVNCGACSAACVLYNGWKVKPRNIYSYNENIYPDLPVVHLSIACNHCKNPACLEGCPSGAFSRDENTGAVVLNEEKCLGCRYCQWNCPFDAPKFSHSKKVIEKCHLCYNSAGIEPSCATACPTGALSFAVIEEESGSYAPEWFPSAKLKPALGFSGEVISKPLEIVPPDTFIRTEYKGSGRTIQQEWSLMIFSFLMMISVSVVTSSLIDGIFPGLLSLVLLPVAAFISLFHLGRPLRAWRSLSNPLSSPLSREILFFILYSSVTITATVFQSPELMITAAISGLLLLLVIDSVYIKPDRKSLLSAGQTFLSALLFVSYLTGNGLPFAFILILKLTLSFRALFKPDLQSIRFLGIAIYTIAGAGFVSGFAVKSIPVTIMIVSGLLLERILFYHDFEPENIKRLIDKHIKERQYEKKRG